MNIVIKQPENCESVEMLINSGVENSMINKLDWEKLGRPKLTPTNYALMTASGTTVDLLGQFTANVIFGQQEYELPLYVTNKDDTSNVIGWRWFPILDLNWNTIFSGKDCKMRQKLRSKHTIAKSRQERTNEHFYITLNVEGTDLPMVLDTGASRSSIGMDHWEKLGYPKLEVDSDCRPTMDIAGETMDIEGKCWVNVKYLGRHRLLPLRVKRNSSTPVIGTNWFHSLHFDFNSIFDGDDNEKPVSPSGSADNSQQNGKKGKCHGIIKNTWVNVKAWFSAWLFEDVPRCYLLAINIKKQQLRE